LWIWRSRPSGSDRAENTDCLLGVHISNEPGGGDDAAHPCIPRHRHVNSFRLLVESFTAAVRFDDHVPQDDARHDSVRRIYDRKDAEDGDSPGLRSPRPSGCTVVPLAQQSPPARIMIDCSQVIDRAFVLLGCGRSTLRPVHAWPSALSQRAPRGIGTLSPRFPRSSRWRNRTASHKPSSLGPSLSRRTPSSPSGRTCSQ
jgi:hypothetical protein